jgi:hypothetical protein
MIPRYRYQVSSFAKEITTFSHNARIIILHQSPIHVYDWYDSSLVDDVSVVSAEYQGDASESTSGDLASKLGLTDESSIPLYTIGSYPPEA